MPETTQINPAEEAAKVALNSVFDCINRNKSFILEAGAGAGKTYSLVHALRFLIKNRGKELLRKRKRIACITYTNVASNEITSRTDSHPVVFSSTIHAFSWALIKNYQPEIRKLLPAIGKWNERLTEAEITEIGTRKVLYDLGHPIIKDHEVWLSHNNVLQIFVEFMNLDKFRQLVTDQFPIIFIDEYQDTDAAIIDAFKLHFLDTKSGPLLGFFGDHWQKIYGNGCGKITHDNLDTIGKKANFRSAKTIVDCLNAMRPDLPQVPNDILTAGEVSVYHTNNWKGQRQKGAHWKGDLPSDEAHQFLVNLKNSLSNSGWDFSPGKSKILMLTHKVLASEQGYRNIADHFSNTDSYNKKEDPYIAFLIGVVEPVCAAFSNKRYGEMFSLLDGRTINIRSHDDKLKWAEDIDILNSLRMSKTIGDVIDHIKKTRRPRLPEKIETSEQILEMAISSPPDEIDDRIEKLKQFRAISYKEIIALSKYHTEHSPFSTKHGVKGAEFENVLLVVGRGWSKYNFNKMLENATKFVSTDQLENFEENRNLFYVACSRPKRRLALLFTQELSDDAISTLKLWFGEKSLHPL